MGRFEAVALAIAERSLGYHPDFSLILTPCRDPGGGQCVLDSLTGAVAS